MMDEVPKTKNLSLEDKPSKKLMKLNHMQLR